MALYLAAANLRIFYRRILREVNYCVHANAAVHEHTETVRAILGSKYACRIPEKVFGALGMLLKKQLLMAYRSSTGDSCK